MAPPSHGQELWTRCTSCRSCEWNSLIVMNKMKCSKCKVELKLFKPQGRAKSVSFTKEEEDDDFFECWDGSEGHPRTRSVSPGRKGRSRERSGKGDGGVTNLLQQALQATGDSTLQAALTMQISRLGAESEASASNVTPVEALKRADGIFRNVEHMHEQQVQSVLRLRSNLAAAELKEQSLALRMAEADQAKKTATIALTKAEGVDTDGPKLFKLQWDDTFFDQIDGEDATPQELADIQRLKDEFQSVKEHFEGKEKQVAEWVEKTRLLKDQLAERKAKKRKVGEEAVAEEATAKKEAPKGAGKPGAKAAETEHDAEKELKLKEEASRISEAKFAAAVAKAKAKGKGDAAEKDDAEL